MRRQKNAIIKKAEANLDGRDFVIGDLHGCFEELGRLLVHVKFDPGKDRLFSTGDLIDRGPYPAECLSLLSKRWFFPVLGNHEDMLLDKMEDFRQGSLSKGEVEYVASLMKYEDELHSIPLIYEIDHLFWGKAFVLHSEVLPEHIFGFSDDQIGGEEYVKAFRRMKKENMSSYLATFFEAQKSGGMDLELKQKLLWSRKIISSFYREHKAKLDKGDLSFVLSERIRQKMKIFCGHNVVPFPMKIGQQYYIDTGAALGYSAMEMNSYLFSQFGHEFFALSMVDISTGICYGCLSGLENKKKKIMKFDKSLYGE